MERTSDTRRDGAALVPIFLLALSILVGWLLASPSFAAEAGSVAANNGGSSAEAQPSGAPDQAIEQGVETDPLEPFNSAMFTFNLKLDDWVLHPVASRYADIAPEAFREAVGRFFDNVEFVPRFANNLFQLRLPQAGGEVARFGINTTLGVAGFFDPADKWFGLKEHPDDFGLTLRYYDVPTGPYLMLPFMGPSTITDAVGRGVDSFMDPQYYFMPLWMSFAVGGGETVAEAVNYRSLHLNQFEEADRYAIDLYGAVQDAYLQTRRVEVRDLKEGK
jgi:phospholipid-binding lipoprotein MlaA